MTSRVRPQAAARCRRGFTLLEVVLVLAVMLAALGTVWPSISRLYQDHGIRNAAQHVQGRLAAARLRALESGLAYQFRYEAEGRKLVVLPYEKEDGPSGADSTPAWTYAGELAEKLQFHEVTAGSTSTQPLAADRLTGLEEQKDLLATPWAAPVLFYPDGTASGGALEIIDQNRRSIRLSIRELTGEVAVSNIENTKTP